MRRSISRIIKNHVVFIIFLLVTLFTVWGCIYIENQGRKEPLVLEDIYGDSSILSKLHVEGEYGSVYDAPDKVKFQFSSDGIRVTDYQRQPLTNTKQSVKETDANLDMKYPDRKRKNGEHNIFYTTGAEGEELQLGWGKNNYASLPELSLSEGVKDWLMTGGYISDGCVKLQDTYYAATVFDVEYYDEELDNIETSPVKGEGGIFYWDSRADEAKCLVTLRMEEGIPLHLLSYHDDLILIRRRLGLIIVELYNVDGEKLDSCELEEDALPDYFSETSDNSCLTTTAGIRVDEATGYVCLSEQYYVSRNEQITEKLYFLLKVFKIENHRIVNRYAFDTKQCRGRSYYGRQGTGFGFSGL